MEIKFVKDLTKAGIDGRNLLFEINGEKIEISISGTKVSEMGFKDIDNLNIDILLEKLKEEAIIDMIDIESKRLQRMNFFLKKVNVSSSKISFRSGKS